MDYIAATIAFLAAVFGVMGDTWNSKKVGMHKITRPGWIIIVLGLVALLVAVLEIMSKNDEIEMLNTRGRVFARHAIVDVNRALDEIDQAFRGLHLSYQSKSQGPDTAAWYEDTAFCFQYIASMDVTAPVDEFAPGPVGESWAHLLARKLSRSRRSLEMTLQLYGPYLSSEEVLSIDSLRTCELLSYFPELEDAYLRSDIKPFFPVMSLPEMVDSYRSLRHRFPDSNSAVSASGR